MDLKLNEEIKKVLVYTGRDTSRGDVKDEHCVKILAHLIEEKKGDYKKMLGILAFKVSMDNRKIRENYLEGLEYMGIINVYSENNTRMWSWVGIPETNKIIDNPEAQPYYEAKRRLQNENTNKKDITE